VAKKIKPWRKFFSPLFSWNDDFYRSTISIGHTQFAVVVAVSTYVFGNSILLTGRVKWLNSTSVRFACPRLCLRHGNTGVKFKSLPSPGQYAIFPAENTKIRIFTGQKNVTFLPEAGKMYYRHRDDASFSNLKYEQDFPVPMWEYWLRFQVLSLYLSVGMNSKSYRFNWKNLDRNKKQNMVKSAKFLCNYAIVSWCRTLLSHCIFQWSKSWTITVVIGDIIFLRQEIS